jgi:hypothetical protein
MIGIDSIGGRMTPPTGKPLNESEREEILRHASPEFQASIRNQETEEAAQQAAHHQEQVEAAIREQKKDDLFGNLVTAGLWLLILTIALALVYALTKFVKWAWYS